MRIEFSKLHIHHFLSFDDSTIDLRNQGYCLIKGINKNPKDAARSNGAGKSTIANAIAFCLLGETLSGLKSNLENNYYNDGCYVELEFKIDNNDYKLIRSKNDAKYDTNLKIFVNQEDKSGKGIRESQAILDELLPDITRELIGSVILLGQGLPDKFTSNSPSGRKEVLEHLSKSDFMIQDLKERVDARLTCLKNKDRDIDNQLLVLSTQKRVQNEQLNTLRDELLKLNTSINFDEEIDIRTKNLNKLEDEFKVNTLKLDALANEKRTLTEKLLTETNLRNDRLTQVSNQYNEFNNELTTSRTTYSLKVNNLQSEITRLKNIKDICPTCGQKIPNVIKPDTSEQEKLLKDAQEMLDVVNQDISNNNKDYKESQQSINEMFENNTNTINKRLKEINDEEKFYNTTTLNSDINKLKLEINSLERDRDNHQSNLQKCIKSIDDLETILNNISNEEKSCNDSRLLLNQHLDVVEKMNTYLKRDFRGVLLQNSIDYINNKAKEYCLSIFNTDEIKFELDGNNIDISYCNKDYDNLSGGEKQRVDLITQFAIRDMLSKHLNFSSNILFLDEITDNLDSDSCDRVINFITNQLKDIESIFIISHHEDELNIPVDNEIVVQKNALGVSEVL